MYLVQPKRLANTLLVSVFAAAATAIPAQASSLAQKAEVSSPDVTVEATEKPVEAELETVPAAAPTAPVPVDATPAEAPLEAAPEVESGIEPDISTEAPDEPALETEPAADLEPTVTPEADGAIDPVEEPAPVAEEPIDTSVMTVVEVAGSSDAFETLTAALEAAELTEQLSGEGPFTVFAPTDEAFAALPEGTLEALLLPENQETLIQILTYHVVPEAVVSADLETDTDTVMTVEGSEVTLSVVENSIYVNDAAVLLADVPASNGVVHVIDQVIIPPELMAQLVLPDATEMPEVSEVSDSSRDAEL